MQMNTQGIAQDAGGTYVFEATHENDIIIPEEAIITFPEGLVGCASWRQFVLLETSVSGPFKLLQSLDDPQVSFIVADPYLLLANYSFTLSEVDAGMIALDDPARAMVLCILMVKQNPVFSITANLLGPLVINVSSRLGTQLVLADSGYSAQFPVMGPDNGSSQ
ncbi:MAG: flagellar assembly protein FliW [Chloroflexi bacterium]|nr:flagellar assembly protein FliW [Chloroflexota bacterium]